MPTSIANHLLVAILPWILLSGLLSILATAFRVLLWPKLKGRLGEAGINFLARRLLDPAVYHLIPDVMLPTPDGTTQIDHVIVSRYGIFVLEALPGLAWGFSLNGVEVESTEVEEHIAFEAFPVAVSA